MVKKITVLSRSNEEHAEWLRNAIEAQGHTVVGGDPATDPDVTADIIVVIDPEEGEVRRQAEATAVTPVVAVTTSELTISIMHRCFHEGAFDVVWAHFNEENAVTQILEAATK